MKRKGVRKPPTRPQPHKWQQTAAIGSPPATSNSSEQTRSEGPRHGPRCMPGAPRFSSVFGFRISPPLFRGPLLSNSHWVSERERDAHHGEMGRRPARCAAISCAVFACCKRKVVTKLEKNRNKRKRKTSLGNFIQKEHSKYRESHPPPLVVRPVLYRLPYAPWRDSNHRPDLLSKWFLIGKNHSASIPARG